jgi:hypothetical protein
MTEASMSGRVYSGRAHLLVGRFSQSAVYAAHDTQRHCVVEFVLVQVVNLDHTRIRSAVR